MTVGCIRISLGAFSRRSIQALMEMREHLCNCIPVIVHLAVLPLQLDDVRAVLLLSPDSTEMFDAPDIPQD